MGVCGVFMQMSASGFGDQKRTSDPLELEIQAVLSHVTWCWDLNSGALKEQ